MWINFGLVGLVIDCKKCSHQIVDLYWFSWFSLHFTEFDCESILVGPKLYRTAIWKIFPISAPTCFEWTNRFQRFTYSYWYDVLVYINYYQFPITLNNNFLFFLTWLKFNLRLSTPILLGCYGDLAFSLIFCKMKN